MKKPPAYEPPRGVPELLTVKEVCAALKISAATLYRQTWRYTKVGSARRYFADDIRLRLTLAARS